MGNDVLLYQFRQKPVETFKEPVEIKSLIPEPAFVTEKNMVRSLHSPQPIISNRTLALHFSPIQLGRRFAAPSHLPSNSDIENPSKPLNLP